MAAHSPLTPVISNAPVVVEWSDIKSQPRVPNYLAGSDPSSVQLNLLFNEEQDTVSFKIRVLLHFEQESGHRKEYVYMCIHPKNVHLLLECSPYQLPHHVATAVRGPTASFRLVLDEPVSILAPLDAPIPLQSRRDHGLLDSLGLLCQHTVLAFHVSQPTISDPALLQHICVAFTGGFIKQKPDNLQDYYRGHGARAVQSLLSPEKPAEEAEADDHAASPPPYPEGAEPPPSSHIPRELPQKRRRRAPEYMSTSSMSTNPPHIGDICAEHFAQQKDHMSEFLRWQKAQMTKFFDQEEARLGPVLARVDCDLQGLEGRLIKRVREHVCEELGETNEGKRHEWEQLIRSLVQDGIVNLEMELEASIARELERGRDDLKFEIKTECLDELKDDLQDGLVSITLPR